MSAENEVAKLNQEREAARSKLHSEMEALQSEKDEAHKLPLPSKVSWCVKIRGMCICMRGAGRLLLKKHLIDCFVRVNV